MPCGTGSPSSRARPGGRAGHRRRARRGGRDGHTAPVARAVGHLPSDYDGRPETIEETAELVTGLGGTGIPSPVDHLDPDQVGRLAERVHTDHGRLDVLVNDIWGGERLKGGPPRGTGRSGSSTSTTACGMLRLASTPT